MEPFDHLTARAAPLDIANLDTDQIIPKQFLKTVEREGLAKGLFHDPRYAGAGVLIAGDNFGCGSSREHAPWALIDFGIRCVIAPGFADIFHNNCFQNGLLPVVLPEEEVRALMAEALGGNHVFEIDLPSQTVTAPSGARVHFEIDPGRKARMLAGIDPIGETLAHRADIDAFEARREGSRPGGLGGA